MNGKIKVKVKAGSHWTGIDSSKVYTAEVCKDNSRIIFLKNDYGEEYGYPAFDFEIVED